MRGLTEEIKLEKEVALQEKTLTEKDHQILELKSLESETSIEDLGNLIGSVCPFRMFCINVVCQFEVEKLH